MALEWDGAAVEIGVLSTGLKTAILSDSVALTNLTSSPPMFVRDIPVFLLLSVAFFLLNWGIRKLFVQPMAHATFAYTMKTRSKIIEKFSQSAMEVFFYGGFSIIGCFIVSRQEWIWPSTLWWKAFIDGGAEKSLMRSDLRAYYLMYGARYFQGLISVFLEAKRKDFWEMVIHHVVTVVVVGVSYAYGWHRVGAIIMLLLDPADVFLHVAKMCKYVSDSKPKSHAMWQQLADVWFALFAIIFIITRCIMYPYVVWSTFFETHWEHGFPERLARLCLSILLVLQFYWLYLLLSAIVRMIRNGGVEDVRSDDDDDDVAAKEKDGSKKQQ